jgi:NAD(P)-dependent dehydrogenase (short-subunit alcohol dehydrogenase family)
MVTNVEKDQGFVQDYSAQCMQRKGEASEVAAGIAYLLSNDATFVTGSVLNVDGGWNC